MMDINVVNVSLGPHEFNEEALKGIDKRELSFNITPRLRYSPESDYVGFQIDMTVMYEKTQVFRSGFLVGLAIVGWARDLQAGLDLNTNREKLPEICKTVWLVATGIVAMQSQSMENQHSGIVLPEIDFGNFSKDVLLIPTAIK